MPSALLLLLSLLPLLLQTSNGTALPAKIENGLNSDCTMTDLPKDLLNERAAVCAQGQSHYAQGEVRMVASGVGPYVLDLPSNLQNGFELTSCACPQSAVWTRTMGRVVMGQSDLIRWTWKVYARRDDCTLELKRDLVEIGCVTDAQCDCPQGEGFVPESEPPDESGSSAEGECECQPVSPIVIDLEGDGFRFSSREDGVEFDLDDNGERGLVPWTRDAWLVLLDEGVVTSGRQMFGDRSPVEAPLAANGYNALRVFDDDMDGKITPADGVWGLLGAWRDGNWNGVAESWEVQSLSAVGVSEIDLQYRESRRTDRHGNVFRYRSRVTVNGKTRWSYDVFVGGGKEIKRTATARTEGRRPATTCNADHCSRRNER